MGWKSKMTFLPMFMEGLTPEMVRRAEEELGETPEVRIQALKDLRRLINEEADFRPLMDDAFLVRFLRAKKYNVQKAFNTLRNFYTFKVRYSKVLTDFKPSEVKTVLEMNNLLIVPRRLPDGTAVGILRMGDFDMDKATSEDFVAACFVCTEIGIEPEATQVCGAVLVFDWNNFTLRMIKHFASPTLLLRVVRLVQDCVPCRIKAFHFINEPFYFNILFNVVKQMLSEKLKKRVHFHGSNLNELHKHVPRDLLPEELGGNMGPMDNREFRAQILNRESHFEKINKYGYQEKKAHFLRKKSSRTMGLYL